MARLGAVVSLLALVLATSFLAVSAGGLTANYYAKTCPSVDKVVRETVYRLYEKKGNIATSLIRFGFHDWFNVSTRLLYVKIWVSLISIFRWYRFEFQFYTSSNLPRMVLLITGRRCIVFA